MNRFFQIMAATTALSALCLAGCGKPPADNRPEQQAAETVVETAPLARTGSPGGARVFFITPADGATVSNPVRFEFGIAGMTVAKAGTRQPDSGHHHLLIDTGLPDLTMPIPADDRHKHFGDGSTSTQISLQPGQHTLRLLLGDYLHIPHDPPVASEPLTITVE